jgi:hypothetical protein
MIPLSNHRFFNFCLSSFASKTCEMYGINELTIFSKGRWSGSVAVGYNLQTYKHELLRKL